MNDLGQAEKCDRHALVVGLYLGVCCSTLLALICAIVGLSLHPTPWLAHYWWGLVIWAVIWFGGCGAFRLIRRYPKIFLSLLGCLCLLAGLSFVAHTWGTLAAMAAIFLWAQYQHGQHIDQKLEAGKFQYRPRTITTARTPSLPNSQQKRVLRLSVVIGVAITLSLMTWSYSRAAAKALAPGFIASSDEATEGAPAPILKTPVVPEPTPPPSINTDLKPTPVPTPEQAPRAELVADPAPVHPQLAPDIDPPPTYATLNDLNHLWRGEPPEGYSWNSWRAQVREWKADAAARAHHQKKNSP